jgi:hypothetical protein
MKIEAYAYIGADGHVMADNSFKDEKQVWQIALGWPADSEIKYHMRLGARVVKVIIEEVEV